MKEVGPSRDSMLLCPFHTANKFKPLVFQTVFTHAAKFSCLSVCIVEGGSLVSSFPSFSRSFRALTIPRT